MIKILSLSKKFKRYRSRWDLLKEIVLRKKHHTLLQALDNVSFEISEGETLGIIGPNGAGKSTLLKILNGVTISDSGTIHIDGKVTGLLELGTGFHTEMTGLENIYFNGLLIGMGKEEIEEKKGEIIEFTELGDYIYEPIKTYSSGMVVRLAFSISMHADPKYFLVDEALAVGDAYFQQKCMMKIKEFMKQGGSIIFVSHDMNAVKMICNKTILLDNGKIVAEGDPESVINKYNYLIAKIGDDERKVYVQKDSTSSYGSFEAKIINVELLSKKCKSSFITAGDNVVIEIDIEAFANLEDINIGIIIRDKYGQDIFGTNSFYHDKCFNITQGEKYRCSFTMEMNIGVGKYTISAALHKGETHLDKCINWVDNALEFEVTGIVSQKFIGVCKLTPIINIKKAN